jgi:hypothetical protein
MSTRNAENTTSLYWLGLWRVKPYVQFFGLYCLRITHVVQGVALSALYWPADEVGSQTPGRLLSGDLNYVTHLAISRRSALVEIHRGLVFVHQVLRSCWIRSSKESSGRSLGGRVCRCLNLSTSMGGTRGKVEGEDRHDLETEGTREDTRHEMYTGSGSRSSYPTSCLG